MRKGARLLCGGEHMLLQGINIESHERELSERPDLTPALLSGNRVNFFNRAAGSRIGSILQGGLAKLSRCFSWNEQAFSPTARVLSLKDDVGMVRSFGRLTFWWCGGFSIHRCVIFSIGKLHKKALPSEIFERCAVCCPQSLSKTAWCLTKTYFSSLFPVFPGIWLLHGVNPVAWSCAAAHWKLPMVGCSQWCWHPSLFAVLGNNVIMSHFRPCRKRELTKQDVRMCQLQYRLVVRNTVW